MPPRPPRMASLLTFAFTVGLAASGCGAQDLAVSWVFVDGRSCADAGVESVAVWAGDEGDLEKRPLARCSTGQEGRALALLQVPARAVVRAAALSPGGGVLYRGAARVPDGDAAIEIVLYFTGGE